MTFDLKNGHPSWDILSYNNVYKQHNLNADYCE